MNKLWYINRILCKNERAISTTLTQILLIIFVITYIYAYVYRAKEADMVYVFCNFLFIYL